MTIVGEGARDNHGAGVEKNELFVDSLELTSIQ